MLHKVMWQHYFRVDIEEYKGIYKTAFQKSLEVSEDSEEERKS